MHGHHGCDPTLAQNRSPSSKDSVILRRLMQNRAPPDDLEKNQTFQLARFTRFTKLGGPGQEQATVTRFSIAIGVL